MANREIYSSITPSNLLFLSFLFVHRILSKFHNIFGPFSHKTSFVSIIENSHPMGFWNFVQLKATPDRGRKERDMQEVPLGSGYDGYTTAGLITRGHLGEFLESPLTCGGYTCPPLSFSDSSWSLWASSVDASSCPRQSSQVGSSLRWPPADSFQQDHWQSQNWHYPPGKCMLLPGQPALITLLPGKSHSILC